MSELLTVALADIDPPPAPIRQHIPEDLIDELATSISAVGLIEPMVVSRAGGRFTIIAGHRRYLACKRAGVISVPVVVRADDGVSVEAVQVQENIIRQDMSPVEEGRLFTRLYAELGEDIELVAGRVRLSVDYVNGRMALIAGDPLIAQALDEGRIVLGVAQALNTIVREDYRRAALDTAIQGGATVNLARRWANDYNRLGSIQSGEPTVQTAAPEVSTYVPMAESVSCFFCEGSEDLHTLRMVQIHANCVGALNALLKRLGKE